MVLFLLPLNMIQTLNNFQPKVMGKQLSVLSYFTFVLLSFFLENNNTIRNSHQALWSAIIKVSNNLLLSLLALVNITSIFY